MPSRFLMLLCFVMCSVSWPMVWMALWGPYSSTPIHGYYADIFGTGTLCKERRIEPMCTEFDSSGGEYTLRLLATLGMVGMLMLLGGSVILTVAMFVEVVDINLPKTASFLLVIGGLFVYASCVTLVKLIPAGMLPDLDTGYPGYYYNVFALAASGTLTIITGFFLAAYSWNCCRRRRRDGEPLRIHAQRRREQEDGNVLAIYAHSGSEHSEEEEEVKEEEEEEEEVKEEEEEVEDDEEFVIPTHDSDSSMDDDCVSLDTQVTSLSGYDTASLRSVIDPRIGAHAVQTSADLD